jgi:hypothetical protein
MFILIQAPAYYMTNPRQKFADMLNPHVMVRVGNKGDTGGMEIQDLMFTAVGPTAGITLMEWNIAQTSAGSVSMWGIF